MGAQNCCGSRDDKNQISFNQPRYSANMRPSTLYRIQQEKQKQNNIKVEEKTFGDLLIEDVVYEVTLPYDNQWQQIAKQDGFNLHVVEWKSEELITIHILRSEFIIRCTPEQFIEYNASIEIQKKVDPKIDGFECFMENQKLKEYLLYISYKGMLLIPGRDFVYYKKVKLIQKAKNVKNRTQFQNKVIQIWCDASKSIEDDRYPSQQKKIRGQVNLAGHLIQPLNNLSQMELDLNYSSIQNPQDYSLVQAFHDIDVRMNISLKNGTKQILNEYKGYIDRIKKYFSSKEQQKIVKE